MNSNRHDNDQISQVINQTFHPHEQSIQHQNHLSEYRCSHKNKSEQISDFQLNSINDYPNILLHDQHIRDLTDVYRREKDFLEERNKFISHNEIFINKEENSKKEFESKYYIKDYYYNIPCNCEISLTKKIFQYFINGIKMGMEFFLFMGYTIIRRNELLECNYSFDKHQSYNYPTYNNEMKKLNTIRNQLNRKRSPIKHTIMNTYYDIH